MGGKGDWKGKGKEKDSWTIFMRIQTWKKDWRCTVLYEYLGDGRRVVGMETFKLFFFV